MPTESRGAAIIGLIGVMIGVCLGAGYEEWKSWQNRKKLKAAMLDSWIIKK